MTQHALTDFQKRVYAALLQIPEGRITTYALMADYLNCKSSQAIGQALKRNPYAPEVPCHRVIKTNLNIGGFHGEVEGEEIKRKIALLAKEGVLFENNKLVDKSLLYDFSGCTEQPFILPTKKQ